MNISVDLQVACQVDSVPPEAEVRSWLEQAYAAGSVDASRRYEVSVRIVGVDEIRHLNMRFRHQNRPTNVLAFPVGNSRAVVDMPEGEAEFLGDLVLCGPLVEQEAEDQGKPPASHWGHLLVHGMLHLLGYDHETDDQAAEMESMEKRILADRGIDDPYRVC